MRELEKGFRLFAIAEAIALIGTLVGILTNYKFFALPATIALIIRFAASRKMSYGWKELTRFFLPAFLLWGIIILYFVRPEPNTVSYLIILAALETIVTIIRTTRFVRTLNEKIDKLENFLTKFLLGPALLQVVYFFAKIFPNIFDIVAQPLHGVSAIILFVGLILYTVYMLWLGKLTGAAANA